MFITCGCVEYLGEYKEEIKKKKVVFPGFRPGKLPPYVMPDVRRYIVCYGLESLIGQLCNQNKLQVISI
jgi:FKBP-type peptidyl-prolyl cis-trans isomerase (trigger factor)